MPHTSEFRGGLHAVLSNGRRTVRHAMSPQNNASRFTLSCTSLFPKVPPGNSPLVLEALDIGFEMSEQSSGLEALDSLDSYGLGSS